MKWLSLIFACLILTGCSNQLRVYSDFDPDYDISSYSSFDWGQKVDIEKGKNPLHYNELNDKRIKAAVLEQLTARGFVQKETDPDLVLHYHIVVEDQSVVVADPYGYNYGPYWMNSSANVRSFRQGSLILDLMDPKTNGLVWRGWAVSIVDGVNNPEQVDSLIKEAVEKIFKRFPQKTGKTSAEKTEINK